jgi:carnitine O-acetyltransferase
VAYKADILRNIEPPRPRYEYKRNPMAVYRERPLHEGVTYASQDKLPKLPIPELAQSCKRYLAALRPLQTNREHAETRHAVNEFLKHDGPELQERLSKYAVGRSSYIEQFCTSSWGNLPRS